MQQLKTFFYSLLKSVSDPEYYNHLLKTKSWFSWKYFLFLQFLLSFIALAYVLPPLQSFEPKQLTDQAVAVFPQELEITANQDGISINQERPYRVSLPGTQLMLDELADDPEATMEAYTDVALVTFADDEQVASIQDFYDFNSFAVLTQSSIYVLEDVDTGEVRIYAMPAFDQTFTVGYEQVAGLADVIVSTPFIAKKAYVPTLAILAVVAVFALTLVWRLFALLIMTLFALVLVKIFGSAHAKTLSFGKLYQLGLHALTLPLLISVALSLFNIYSFAGLPFVAAYLLWILFIASNLEADSEVTKEVVVKKTVVKRSAVKKAVAKKTR